MTDIERQVAPCVGRRRRHLALRLEAEREDGFDAVATPLEGGEQRPPIHSTQIDERWNRDPVRQAQRANPARAHVMQVRDDRADRAAWGDTWNGRIPEGGWQLLHQVGRDATIRPPSREHGGPKIEWLCHGLFSFWLDAADAYFAFTASLAAYRRSASSRTSRYAT